MTTHPDHNKHEDAELQFKAVADAFNILSKSCESASAACSSCGDACKSQWTQPDGARFVWNDHMLPELFACLISETGDSRLQTLYKNYVANLLSRKEALLSIHSFATREQFRQALHVVAERHGREGGEQRTMQSS